ncbi:MAG: UDP-N-acetylmuramate dehydrogenase [Candidatus Eisenbacteria bacterium]|nr:UDP-N-acetylmuramate dehydrogenase [Candidatus Eisenbacteria bacterium]
MSGASGLYESIENIRGVRCRRNVSLATLTSFKVGGPADVLAVAEDAEGLRSILVRFADAGAKWFLLGAGTNVVFGDAGFRGVVVKLGPGFAGIVRKGTGIFAGASASWSELLSSCAESGLAGLERMSGIPGTVGGAVFGNAGAFGVTVGDRVEWASGMNARGVERKLARDEMEFSYRHASFPSGFVLTQVAMCLENGEKGAILATTDEILARRREKQPLELPSAGSVFKNPPEAKAARLIEQAGLKGRRVGGAEVSEKHANFIVNKGGATAGDILSLIDIVREEVCKRFSVGLELEVKVVE